MATYVENTVPHAHESSSSGMGFLMGAILLIVFLVVLFYFGLPLLRGATQAPQVNVPGTIDVNVNQPK